MGNREIIEFFSQKLETRDFLKSSLLKNEAATPLQPSCRSCLWAQAAASVREQLGAAFQALALGPGLRYPGALSSLPSPPAAADASPAAASNLRLGAGNIQCSSAFLFFFSLPRQGRLQTHYLYIQTERRFPFLLGLAGVGLEQRVVPESPPLSMPGDSFFGSPSQKPTPVRLALPSLSFLLLSLVSFTL